ncbi:hypothetical protein [Mesorhizobium sp. CN2-181]|uniref:hypothetical protein n=1 Tax=Mesorhizobium yinganensis TaxID=3157707 RepID=UPI0032B826A5
MGINTQTFVATPPQAATQQTGSSLFGHQQRNGGNAPRRGQRVDQYGNPLPEAEFWANIGYYEYVGTEGDIEFISAGGIPLDQPAEERPTSNQRMIDINQLKAGLRESLIDLCKEIQPGETRDIVVTDVLVIQLRRRGANRTASFDAGQAKASLSSRLKASLAPKQELQPAE